MTLANKKTKPSLKIRIATRKSQLAIWQAEFIGQKIKDYDGNCEIQ